MKILTAQQLRELDELTIQHQNISSLDLMQRAAGMCFYWIQNNIPLNQSFTVVCGPGNNGGDGLVIAKLLAESSQNVECVLLDFSDRKTIENSLNLELLKKTTCTITTVQEDQDLEKLNLNGKVVVDAIFGCGLNRSAEGIAEKFINKINDSKTKNVISIDLPSGLYSEKINAEKDSIVQADKTLTFHVPKLSFFFPERGNAVGNVEVLDIRLEKCYETDLSSKNYFIHPSFVSNIIKKRKIFSHKGTYGHANIIAGSRGKIGAAVLASKSASYSGVGLVTVTIPSIGLNVVQSQVPVTMCDDSYGENYLEGELILNDKHTIGIGPGIGNSEKTVSFLKYILQHSVNPIVIDADALNCISENPELVQYIPENSILTPHIKEFERLVGKSENSLQRFDQLANFCKLNKVYVVLKDARTVICSPEGECFFSLNGTPGMATGGSGDVLTGLLTGLLAQGYSSLEVTQLGVVLHGLAGELAANKHSEFSMTSENILEHIGEGFKILLRD